MQEPQGAEKIEACVRAKYSPSFRLFEKVHVNGPATHPVYRWLRLKGSDDAGAIGWNFNMFLVGRDGETCTRYANSRTPSSIRDDILGALEAKAPPAQIAPPEAPTKAEAVAAIAAESPMSVLAAE